MQTKNPCTITVGPVRLSYCHLFEPDSIEEGAPKKYSTACIIPKSDKASIAKINAAIEAAKVAAKDGKFAGKIPANLRTPLRDGDEEKPDDEAYAKSYFFNASSLQRPGVVGPDRQPIMDADSVYSGCYGYVNITLFGYNTAGNRGVGAALNHVMKVKDGERLGGKLSADEAFEGIDVDDDLM